MGDHFATHKRIGQTREENTPRARRRKQYRKHHRCLEKGYDEGEDSGGGEPPTSQSRTQVLQALGMVRGHCAMKPEERIEEGGKKALTHNRVRSKW
jgi:hypothetical protein